MTEKEKQELARKIQGWLPDGTLDMGMIAQRLRFIGLALASPELADDMGCDEIVGAGIIAMDLAKEQKTWTMSTVNFLRN